MMEKLSFLNKVLIITAGVFALTACGAETSLEKTEIGQQLSDEAIVTEELSDDAVDGSYTPIGVDSVITEYVPLEVDTLDTVVDYFEDDVMFDAKSRLEELNVTNEPKLKKIVYNDNRDLAYMTVNVDNSNIEFVYTVFDDGFVCSDMCAYDVCPMYVWTERGRDEIKDLVLKSFAKAVDINPNRVYEIHKYEKGGWICTNTQDEEDVIILDLNSDTECTGSCCSSGTSSCCKSGNCGG